MCTDIIILAGGSGERLWPVSDSEKPKQFMTFIDGDSFLQSALRRAALLDIEGQICIVTRKEWIPLVIADVNNLVERMDIPEFRSKILVMGEPYGKNTAPAITWTAKYLLTQKRTEPVNILLMASDHIIKPLDAFIADVKTASWFSAQKNLVSFSIKPVTANIGYGYIKLGTSLSCPLEYSSPAYTIETFKEKPDYKTACSYLKNGNYYWNSGIYAFRADFYLEELSEHCPEMTQAFASLGSVFRFETQNDIQIMIFHEGLDEAYKKSPSLSIDYAMSEKCTRAVSIRSSFLWDDAGTWDSLADYYDQTVGTKFAVDSENCFVYSDLPIALCGVDDLIVIIKNGKVLISKKGKTNLVKDAISLMKKKANN